MWQSTHWLGWSNDRFTVRVGVSNANIQGDEALGFQYTLKKLPYKIDCVPESFLLIYYTLQNTSTPEPLS